ncbi:MAG: hypothetical protein P1V18_00400 [Candidatus Gracilibacteria bacterium]|nr:hypothetical protein [Candidatus Gracilibacteria bacterium]
MIHPLHNPSPLLPKRFLYFAEEGGPSESFGPDEGATGVSEEAAERAAEERRKTAQATKAQRKQEKKAKKREGSLADLIREFMQRRNEDRLILLISRLLERNTPVTIILAVLSLVYPEMKETLANTILEDEQDLIPDEKPNESFEENTKALVQYGQELTQALSGWTQLIFSHASFHPMKTILALAHHHGVDKNMVNLSEVMITRFFESSGQEIETDRIQNFADLYWKDALKRLHKLADDRGLLPEPSKDPLSDDDDDDDDT